MSKTPRDYTELPSSMQPKAGRVRRLLDGGFPVTNKTVGHELAAYVGWNADLLKAGEEKDIPPKYVIDVEDFLREQIRVFGEEYDNDLYEDLSIYAGLTKGAKRKSAAERMRMIMHRHRANDIKAAYQIRDEIVMLLTWQIAKLDAREIDR